MARLVFFLILVASICITTIAATPAAEKDCLHQCANHIGECGKQIFNKLFTSNKIVISTDCCYKLFQTGSYCHTKMTLFILQTHKKYKKEEWLQFLFKGDEIFHKCDLVTRPENPNFFATCINELGSRCGEEVFNSIVNENNISKKCCGKLVKMGEKCHINMAKALIRTPEMRNIDAIEFLEKNKMIFDNCKIAD